MILHGEIIRINLFSFPQNEDLFTWKGYCNYLLISIQHPELSI